MATDAHRVYLIHFEQPFGHALHYVGFARDLRRRIARHRSGAGSRLLFHVQNAGIKWYVVRTWQRDKAYERLLKRHSHVKRVCPVCKGKDLVRTARRWPVCNGEVL